MHPRQPGSTYSVQTIIYIDESKYKLKEYAERSKIKDLIRLKNNRADDYNEKYMKIKFISDNNLLPLKKKIRTV